MIIDAWEAYNYPIYGLIWHPELLLFETISDNYWNHNDNMIVKKEVAYRASKFFHTQAQKNSNRVPKQWEDLIFNKMAVDIGPMKLMPRPKGRIHWVVYGYNKTRHTAVLV